MKIKLSKKYIPIIAIGCITLSQNPVKGAEIELIGISGNKQIEVNEDPTIEYEKVKVCTSDLNVRRNPSIESEILGILPYGTQISDINHQEGWYQILYNEQFGYVCDQYIEEKTRINGTPKKIIYMNMDTSLLDLNTNEYKTTLPYLETAEVYKEDEEYYTVNTDQGIGKVEKSTTTDLTGNYVIIDISEQELNLYQDSTLVLDTPVVTGKDTTPTDLGLYNVYMKEQNCILQGPGYETPVNYWMPFNGGEGMHDNIERQQFGKNINKTNGSHGCVNMPLEAAEEAYNILEIGDKVLVKE